MRHRSLNEIEQIKRQMADDLGERYWAFGVMLEELQAGQKVTAWILIGLGVPTVVLLALILWRSW